MSLLYDDDTLYDDPNESYDGIIRPPVFGSGGSRRGKRIPVARTQYVPMSLDGTRLIPDETLRQRQRRRMVDIMAALWLLDDY